MNKIELYLGDCLEKMKLIKDNSIDMVLCDLPYGTTSCSWDTIVDFKLLWKEYNRIIKSNKCMALFGNEPFSSYLRMSNIKNYKYDWIWDKISTNGFLNAKKRPLKQIENIMVFSNGLPIYYPIMVQRGKPRQKGAYNKKMGNGDMVYGKFKNIKSFNNIYYPTNLIQFSNASKKNKLHSTQKPVALLEYLIKTYTNENELVLDNCMGSGSTAIACINTKRNFIGIELDEKYFEISKKRILENKNLINDFELVTYE